jgi:hypothetical protein
MRISTPSDEIDPMVSFPWVMKMRALSSEDPNKLAQTLTGAILCCGGWVLGDSACKAGTVSMSIEFERRACLDIYSALIAAGVELSRSGHLKLTELCHCTLSHPQDCATEIANIELEILTDPAELIRGSRAGVSPQGKHFSKE